jgi:hypothetical protein
MRGVIVPRALVVLERHALAGAQRGDPLQRNREGYQHRKEEVSQLLHPSAMLPSASTSINLTSPNSGVLWNP